MKPGTFRVDTGAVPILLSCSWRFSLGVASAQRMPRHRAARFTCSLHFRHRQLNLCLTGVLEPRCSEATWGNGVCATSSRTTLSTPTAASFVAALNGCHPAAGLRPAGLPDPQQGACRQQGRPDRRYWKGRIVSNGITTRLNAARSAIGETGEEQRLIKTLPRKGFRFVGTVREAEGPAAATAADNPEATAKPASRFPTSLRSRCFPSQT